MIKIISADINVGKTTWMRNQYNTEKKGDGFICAKTFHEGTHSGYNLLHLSTNLEKEFIRKTQFIPQKWHESFRIANFFSFNKNGFEFAENITKQAIKKNLSPFYLDEIGPLELEDKGFSRIFKRLLKTDLELIVAVRSFLVSDIVQHFEISDYTEIKL